MARLRKWEKRATALGAARSELRSKNIRPEKASANDALRVLDDLLRTEPDLVASEWYNDATENQVRLFVRDWNVWILSQK